MYTSDGLKRVADQCAPGISPRIVYQDIQAATLINGLINRLLPLLLDSDILSTGKRPATLGIERAGKLFTAIQIEISKHYRRAGRGQLAGTCSANTRCRACHQGYFSAQICEITHRIVLIFIVSF
jgi:hypothetical protein